MKSFQRALGTLVFCALMVASAPVHAGEAVDLTYDTPAAGQLSGPAVGVSFENARPSKKGGDELKLVGQVRTPIGIPFGLFSREVPGHVDTVVPRWTADYLRAAGIQATAGQQGGGPRVHVVLERLWCDGNTRYVLAITARIQVFAAGATSPTLEKVVIGKGGATAVIGSGPLERGFKRMFEDAGGELKAWAATPEFKAALGVK